MNNDLFRFIQIHQKYTTKNTKKRQYVEKLAKFRIFSEF